MAVAHMCWAPMTDLGKGCFWELFSSEWPSLLKVKAHCLMFISSCRYNLFLSFSLSVNTQPNNSYVCIYVYMLYNLMLGGRQSTDPAELLSPVVLRSHRLPLPLSPRPGSPLPRL